MNLQKNIEALNIELDQFITLLNKTLPRYSMLVKKNDLNEMELQELGEMEYHLIEINAKINDLKHKLQHDLFGLSIDTYYKLKQKAQKGDTSAQEKMDKMKEPYLKSFKDNSIFNWN